MLCFDTLRVFFFFRWGNSINYCAHFIASGKICGKIGEKRAFKMFGKNRFNGFQAVKKVLMVRWTLFLQDFIHHDYE